MTVGPALRFGVIKAGSDPGPYLLTTISQIICILELESNQEMLFFFFPSFFLFLNTQALLIHLQATGGPEWINQAFTEGLLPLFICW